MTAVIWRDIENNKVYVKYGLETIEVPHAIAEAYKQEEARDFRLIYSEVDSLKAKNTKLRELVRWMYDRMDESCAAQYPYAPTPISYDRLMQAQARARELGVEVNEQ